MSETPRDPDDATATPDPSPGEDKIPEPDYGSSAFDEPTVRIPVAEDTSEAGRTQAFPVRGARVLSTESDLPDGDDPTQRIPNYDQLSAPRREPTEVAAAMDVHLADDEHPKRGTLDTGLLLIRLGLGAILFAHGLRTLTGWWGGPGISGLETVLQGLGLQYAQQLSYAVPVTEVIVGAMLVLGLLMPVAAAVAVAVLINTWAAGQADAPGLQFFVEHGGDRGVELETMLLAAAAGLCLTGAGRLSLDANRGWTRRPKWGSLTFLLLGIIAGVAAWVVLGGPNPLG